MPMFPPHSAALKSLFTSQSPAAVLCLSSQAHALHRHSLESGQGLEGNLYANFSGFLSVVSTLRSSALTITDALESPKPNNCFFYPLLFPPSSHTALLCFFNFLRNDLEISSRQQASMNGKLTSRAFLLSKITALYCPCFSV